MNPEEILTKAPKTQIPAKIKPMMATLIDKPFSAPDYLFEIKWDGYRTIAKINNAKANLYSRYGNSFDDDFSEVRSALNGFPQAVLDGEVVVLDENGRPSFELLQNYKQTREGEIVYFVFDLLFYEGRNLTNLPLLKRRLILESLKLPEPKVALSETVAEEGEPFFAGLKQLSMEGMMAKKITSPYEQGKRDKNWLKIKIHQEQEAVIGGFTKPKGSRVGFGSLLLGVYNNDRFEYIGSVGTGFNEYNLVDLAKKLDPLRENNSSFVNPPKYPGVTWVRPQIVCEVKFQEWTKDGKMRQSVFLGLRSDKKPKEVIRELPRKKKSEINGD